ncbi:MAG: carbohydrate kinase family protein [Anaerolineae bacterium]
MALQFAVTSALSIDQITFGGVERITIGSCGFYVALALARLGAEVLYAGAHGTDFPFEQMDVLRASSAEVALCPLEGRNAHLRLVYDAVGDIVSVNYDEGVGSQFRVDHLPRDFWQAEVLWMGSAPLALQQGITARGAQEGKRVYLSTQNEFAGRFEQLVELVPHLSLLFINSREVTKLQPGGLSANIHALLRHRPELGMVITRGGRGAWLIRDGWLYSAAAVPNPRIVNTIGAGDAFAAAFAWQEIQGAPPAACLRWAITAATLSLREYAYFGLPSAAEVEHYLTAVSADLTVEQMPLDSPEAQAAIESEAAVV